MEIVRQLRDPDQAIRANIEHTLKRLPIPERSEIEVSLKWVDDYQRSFENNILAHLTLDKVEDTRRPQRVLERLKKAESSAGTREETNTIIPKTSTNTTNMIVNVQSSDVESDINDQEQESVQPDSSKDASVTPNPNAAKLNRERLDQYFAEAILEGEDEKCEEITRALNDAVENYSPKEEMPSRKLCKGEVGKELLQNRYYRHRLFLWKRSSL